MGKSLRASRNKANKSQLRSIVFEPAENARKERLSAKLIKLVSQPQQASERCMKRKDGEEVTIKERSEEIEAKVTADGDEMDVDRAKQPRSTAESVSRRTPQVQKRGRGKARAAMVFPIYKKGTSIGTRLSASGRKTNRKP